MIDQRGPPPGFSEHRFCCVESSGPGSTRIVFVCERMQAYGYSELTKDIDADNDKARSMAFDEAWCMYNEEHDYG